MQFCFDSERERIRLIFLSIRTLLKLLSIFIMVPVFVCVPLYRFVLNLSLKLNDFGTNFLSISISTIFLYIHIDWIKHEMHLLPLKKLNSIPIFFTNPFDCWALLFLPFDFFLFIANHYPWFLKFQLEWKVNFMNLWPSKCWRKKNAKKKNCFSIVFFFTNGMSYWIDFMWQETTRIMTTPV